MKEFQGQKRQQVNQDIYSQLYLRMGDLHLKSQTFEASKNFIR